MPLLIQKTTRCSSQWTDWEGSYDPDFKFLTNVKMQSDSQKKNVFDSKIQFLRSAEYDHRLKIKNLVVAYHTQVLTKAFAGVIRQRHPFIFFTNLCNNSDPVYWVRGNKDK